ncbi:hypothetical protein CDAR_414821 [Caerostris darwini]|uniref:Uncharacterized protein n=1 Tax=Caerostris darwini TaxID=1538125 RepID=A0AAV4RGR5_9ARAC|nr:hypothetical protein CDAR_414821 [Caerostris darwini]
MTHSPQHQNNLTFRSWQSGGICLFSRCTGHRSMKRSFLVIHFQEEGLDREMEEHIPVGRRGVCCTFSPDPISRHFAPRVAGPGGKSLGTFWTAMIGP